VFAKEPGGKVPAPMQGGAISGGSSGGQASTRRSRRISSGIPTRLGFWSLGPSWWISRCCWGM
jgi:hypothetical protein